MLVRADQIADLLQPAFRALVGVAFVASIFLAIFDVADYRGRGAWWTLLFFFLLGYGGIPLGCIARGARTGPRGIILSVLIVPVYAAYSWLIWPALARAAGRQVTPAGRMDEDRPRADQGRDTVSRSRACEPTSLEPTSSETA
jgi:hypothetical protein